MLLRIIISTYCANLSMQKLLFCQNYCAVEATVRIALLRNYSAQFCSYHQESGELSVTTVPATCMEGVHASGYQNHMGLPVEAIFFGYFGPFHVGGMPKKSKMVAANANS